MSTEKLKTGKSGKSRAMLILIAVIILVIGVIMTISSLRERSAQKQYSAAQLKKAPGIESTPGSETTSEEFVRLQRQQNLEAARQAAEKGTSSVPTITRTGRVGGELELFADQGESARQAREVNPEDCIPEKLKLAREAGVTAFELECRGCTVREISQAGYTLGELAQAEFSASELRAAGFSAEDLRNAGFNAEQLTAAGFSTNALKDAGFSTAELKNNGVSATNLRQTGYSIDDLKAAGFTAEELKVTGALVEDLKKAGYTPKALKDAGFNALDLASAGYSTPELVAAGYSNQQLDQANISEDEIAAAREAVGELGKLPADCDEGSLIKARNQGFSAEEIRVNLNCPPENLKAAGYSAADLAEAGLTTAELNSAGLTAEELLAAGFSPEALRQGGYSAADLTNTGQTLGELAQAGYLPKDLIAAGYSIEDIKDLGSFAPEAFREDGISAEQLKAAGYTNGDLIRAGYSAEEIVGSPEAILQSRIQAAERVVPSGVAVEDIRFTAEQIKEEGGTAAELRAEGFSALQLKEAGFTDQELAEAGYSSEEIATVQDVLPKPGGTSLTAEQLQRMQVAGDEEMAVETVTGGPSTEEIAAMVSSFTESIGDSEARPALPAPTTATTAAPQPTGLAETSGVPALPDEEARQAALIAALQERQAAQISGQQRQELARQIESNMGSQAGDLISSWSPVGQQVVYGIQEPEQSRSNGKDNSEEGGLSVKPEGQLAGGASLGNGNQSEIIKAGDILFAVLDTSVNSDEQSPILATIVLGELKGSKLLGKFQRVEKKVVLSFSTMSVPDLPRSISINAVAIDPDTARTAVASDVDNHYMLRYGTLFASSFISGLATAISQSGSTVVTEPFGSSVITNPTTTTSEQALIALGNVGTQYANVLGKNFNTPPTVTVNAGESLGILFMSDLQVPARQKNK
jgi:intracellular multiplication protein IcmE